ncbi:uncharacterized protein EI90DRAFT_3085703 [Cantharellus anzutake]|uniref:uncharacterized protein n=1 Tax=Cantharellus anzutake TaxID=1750568 RepID=UPI00190542CC|nr:uncharacterized protein EI90DRAFT_3085703 [Cantharellus anzutake]KAF8317017.1 hypothetical protein EI90DRAFT_3085703 [Cantharellus anzutake]
MQLRDSGTQQHKKRGADKPAEKARCVTGRRRCCRKAISHDNPAMIDILQRYLGLSSAGLIGLQCLPISNEPRNTFCSEVAVCCDGVQL